MNVVVTGGSGRIGRYVVREFAAFGHDVLNLDTAAPVGAPGRYVRADLTNTGQVYQALAQARPGAVVHLGAWPDAGIVPDSRTYGDNVRSTFNVFQACADLGITRIVSASSAQVYGFAESPPAYAPVDEAHPLRPANCYALSKMAGEQAADYFVHNWGLTILSFRFMGVRPPADIGAEIAAMRKNPASGAWLLWTRTDARDAARACRLAVEKACVASGPYNITGSEVVLVETTRELIANHCGGRTAVRQALAEHASPLSCERARSAFGYRLRFVWSETTGHPEPA
jgi:nucleoside-diphosphate-sugar epimerase